MAKLSITKTENINITKIYARIAFNFINHLPN